MNYRTLLYTCFIFLSLATIVTIVGTTQKEGGRPSLWDLWLKADPIQYSSLHMQVPV
jgi:hypothetical protein